MTPSSLALALLGLYVAGSIAYVYRWRGQCARRIEMPSR